MHNLISTRGKFPSNFNLVPRRPASTTPPPPPLSSAVHKNVFEVIGKTPLVKLNHPDKLFQDLSMENKEIMCHILLKLEYLNPGGSIKDRIGKSLMDVVKKPELNLTKGEKYFLEASSGNTGIAISMNVAKAVSEKLCAGCYIVTNEKCSDEKINVMKLLGANVCIIKSTQSEQGVVDEAINKEPHRSIVLEQFVNQVNPQTHYVHTAEEIYTDLGQKWPDMIVMGAGSGGTFTGIATRIKDVTSECRIVAADPQNSTIFHYNPFPAPFLVEGLAGSTVPLNLDKSLSDECQTVSDKEAFFTARNLAKNEGILCGGSSGLAVAAAIKAIVKNDAINKPGKVVVVILPDGIRNYMTKFVLDQWMEAHMFKEIPALEPNWYNYPIDDHEDNLFIKTLKCLPKKDEQNCAEFFLDKNTPAKEALESMLNKGHAVAIITDKNDIFNDIHLTVGLASLNSFRHHLTNPRQMPFESYEKENTALSKPVTYFMERELFMVKFSLTANDKKPTVGLVARILDLNQYAILGYERKDPKTHLLTFHGKYLATAKDVLTFRKILSRPA